MENFEITSSIGGDIKKAIAGHIIKYLKPRGGTGQTGTGEMTVAGVYFGDTNAIRFYRINVNMQKYYNAKVRSWQIQYSNIKERPWIEKSTEKATS